MGLIKRKINKIKVYLKTFGDNCTDIPGQCDQSKGLYCQGTTGLKKCLWVFDLFIKKKRHAVYSVLTF